MIVPSKILEKCPEASYTVTEFLVFRFPSRNTIF